MRSVFTQQILGLDLGSSSVKAVSLRKGIMGIEWVGAYRHDRPRVISPWEWAREPISGLKEWLAQNRLSTDRVVVSVPLHFVSIRSLTLPFSESRRIEKVVPFEVEGLIPYPLEEVVVDYEVVETSDGKTRLVAAAVPIGLLKGFLKQLAAIGIDPEAVELDAMALMNLARHLLPGKNAAAERSMEEGGLAVVDIGAVKTAVCVMRGGRPVYLRSILYGGQDVTAAVMERFGVSFEEAEDWKRQAGLLDEEIPGLGQKGLSQVIRQSLTPFLDELSRSFHMGSADGDGSVTEFALCGGGGKLRGLETHMASELGLNPLHRVPKLGTEEGTPWDPVFGPGLGLALKGARLPGASRMNFRRGEFAYSREATGAMARSRTIGIGALILAVLAAADLYVQYSLKSSRYQTLKAEVRKEFQSMFPEVRTIVDEVQQARTAMAELKKRSLFIGQEPMSPLEMMAELTRRMPPSVKIEVVDLVIEPNRLRLEAQTDSFESVDKIKGALTQFRAFKEVSVSDAKVSADQSRVRFRLTVTVASREPA